MITEVPTRLKTAPAPQKQRWQFPNNGTTLAQLQEEQIQWMRSTVNPDVKNETSWTKNNIWEIKCHNTIHTCEVHPFPKWDMPNQHAWQILRSLIPNPPRAKHHTPTIQRVVPKHSEYTSHPWHSSQRARLFSILRQLQYQSESAAL